MERREEDSKISIDIKEEKRKEKERRGKEGRGGEDTQGRVGADQGQGEGEEGEKEEEEDGGPHGFLHISPFAFSSPLSTRKREERNLKEKGREKEVKEALTSEENGRGGGEGVGFPRVASKRHVPIQ